MTVAISHVRIKGTTYWFRRRVPTALTLLVGRKEILRSLRTSNAREARRRANLLWVQADRIFEKMADNKDSSELEALYQQIESLGKEYLEVAESQEQAIDMLETANRIQKLESELALANKDVEIASLKENSALKDMVIVDKVGKLKPSPKLTKKIDDYVSQLRQVGDNGKVTTEQTISQIRMTIRLFQEFFGDKPVREYGRDVGADFKKLLGQLPSSHGKSRSNPMTGPQAIKANQALAAPLKAISPKTIKRHFSGIAGYWNFLKEAGSVDENIFYGHTHRGAKSKRGQRDDWSDADLLKILKSEKWYGPNMDRQSGYFWMPLIAMFSGMRAEEIARLRPQDIQKINGVDCFNLSEHADGWSPKSEAGIRFVPVHSMLKQMGLLEFVATRAKQDRLFYDFQPSGPDKKYSSKFSREFSRIKIGMGITKKTVFHSFRHSVRTILDNSDATIRDSWIDAVMGHAADENASIGRRVYMKRTEIDKVVQVVNAICYPKEITDFLTEKFC